MPNPPKPVERQRKLGNPGKRPLRSLPSVEQTPGQMVAPPHLGSAGSAVWSSVTEFAGHWLAPSDMAALVLLAEAFDRRAEWQARLEQESEVLYTDKGYAYANPRVGMLATLEKQMTSWLSLLGLTPTDRSKLGLAEVKAVDKIDQILSRRASQ